MKKILIGQLGVYGDCLYATTIARQIKHDNPDCHLTWAIGEKYKDILDCNPHIDVVLPVVTVQSRTDVKKYWFDFVNSVKEMRGYSQYDEVYFTQIYPGHPELYRDSIRASMFRVYGKPITVPLDPVLRLTNSEVSTVKTFAEFHHLDKYKNVVLFEHSPQSDQSFLTSDDVEEISLSLTKDPQNCVILSGASRAEYCNLRILDASHLSFRENAELTKYCTLFVGTGSGITQICQSEWAQKLPTIQLLQKRTVASLEVDHKSLGLPTDNILEMTTQDVDRIIECISDAFRFPVSMVKKHYGEEIIPDFNIIRFHMRFDIAMLNGRKIDILKAVAIAIKEYGFDIRGLWHFFLSFPKSIIRIRTRKAEGVY